MIKLNDNNINAFSANKIYLGDNVVFQGFKSNEEGKIDKIVGKVVTTVDNQKIQMSYGTNYFSNYHINELNVDATSNTYKFPTAGEYTIEYTTIQPLDEFSSMFYCFYNCKSLTSITLPSSLPNVNNMFCCFDGCTSLQSVTLPSSLPNVTTMGSCFNNCHSLTSITLPELPNVTNMSNCFYNCKSLTSITLPELPKVTNMYYCFGYCSSLTSITLPSSLTNVNNMESCFWGCSSLTSITLPEMSNISVIRNCFNDCSSLTSIDFGLNTFNIIQSGPEPWMDDWLNCFFNCTSLNHIRCTQAAKDNLLLHSSNGISTTPIGKGQGTWEIIG